MNLTILHFTPAMDRVNNFTEVDDESLDIFARPARVLVSGASDSGKSRLVTKLMLKYHENFDVILICGVAQHELEKNPEVSFKIVVSESIVSPLMYKTKENDRVLFVLDDCYREALASDLVCNLFTRGRHLGVSIVLIVQNIFGKGKFARDITLNCSHIILLKQRDLSQISVIARQCFGPQRARQFLEVYKEVVADYPFGYLLLDLSAHTRPELQIRTFIVNDAPYEIAITWN